MTLNELIPSVRGFDIIVVTGSQRSGTTIATKILADSLGYGTVFEETFREDDIGLFGEVVATRSKCVIQAPGLSSIVHLLKRSNMCVVFMRRDFNDVLASQERIDWTKTHDGYEKAKYHLPETDARPIAAIKCDMWASQKHLLRSRAFDLDYESMAGHRLWIEKAFRRDFGSRQTEVASQGSTPEHSTVHVRNRSGA